MKTLARVGFAFAALTLAPGAFAADMAVKAPPIVVDTWTGFYVGVNGGYSWAHWDSSSVASIFPGGTGFTTTFDPNVKGWVFGGQAGFNRQIDTRWVIGVEADIQATGERASIAGARTFTTPISSDFHLVTNQTTSDEWKFPWFGTLRVRGGVLVDPQTLFYATAGAAVGEFKFANAFVSTSQLFLGQTSTTPAGPPITVASALAATTTRAGAAVGAGIERKFAPNWSVKGEYLYLDFGTANVFTASGFDTSIRLHDHIFRVGINYQFGGPVVAKY
jgi:outer membrane immunogenic protein